MIGINKVTNHTVRWTIEKIAQRLALIEPLVYRRRQTLPVFRYLALPDPTAAPPVAPEVDDREWPVILPNTHWGQPDTDFVLRSHFLIPPDWNKELPVGLYLPLGDAANFSHPEALVYIDGQPYAACDRHHQEVLLKPEWCDGRVHSLALHGWTGLGGNWNTDPATLLVMRACALVQIDQLARDFIITSRVTLGAATALDEQSPARSGLLNALNAGFNLLDTREPFGDAFYDSLAPAHDTLCRGIEGAGPPLDVLLTAVGHAHIDVAWLWPLDQTRRKARRSFFTVLRLMEQFPEFHFTQSQPQLYEFVRQDHPEIFEGIQALVAEGRWEPIGGMWVEADCNLSGPESLARQFLLGRTFYRKHFGQEAESPVLWLPDVFGFTWSLPQLIKQAGLKYFFTIKLGWNQYNRLPFDSFWWQGLDGTRVLAHFSTTTDTDSTTASTYNAPARAEDVLRAWKMLKQKDVQREVFMAFGYGDGGGGPTREMLENLHAMKAFPGLPRARQRQAGEFFRDLEQNAGEQLPVWNGELYLELHRGTYTTQSRNKRANRKSEFLLHDAEFLAAMASWLDPEYSYPAEDFHQAWQLVCLNQFHDIIPGSSIGKVYAESQRQYADVRRIANQASEAALKVVAGKQDCDILLVNPTGFVRRDLAFLPASLPSGSSFIRQDGQPVRTQITETGTWIDAGSLPPYSATGLRRSPDDVVPPARSPGILKVSPVEMENDVLRVELNSNGDITRIFDKANHREILPMGAIANQFQAFEDRPKFWEAWDIDIYYDDRMWLAEPAEAVRVVENGPLRATLEITRRILNSTYTQRISLVYNSPRLDIATTIVWRERHILLKAAFPADILTQKATYEIQWGNIERPTHQNTSWDWARFETCAQKWVDLSEGGYGVSLLNDCKYGHDIRDNIIRISLLRSPTAPDPQADQGEHHFVYSLLPHAGGWETATIAEAYALNDPLIVKHTFRRETPDAIQGLPLAFIQCDAPNIVIETIKQAEDGQGIIVRLYESQRRRGEVTMTTGFPLAEVQRADLLEGSQSELTPNGSRFSLTIRPYEIVTLRLVPIASP